MKSKRTRRDGAPVWQVYKITFADGCEYVGMTCQTVRQRITKHKNPDSFTNLALRQRLIAGVPFAWVVLSRHRKKCRAESAELRAIRKLSKPLNIAGLTPAPRILKTPPRRYDDKHPAATCSLCGKTKSADCFNSDRSRFNGMDSRCKDCSYQLRGLYRQLLKDDPDKKATAWARARETFLHKLKAEGAAA